MTKTIYVRNDDLYDACSVKLQRFGLTVSEFLQRSMALYVSDVSTYSALFAREIFNPVVIETARNFSNE